MRAHQIMSRPVITITPETTIVEAANTMLQRHVSGLPVVDAAGKLVGIISEGDFLRRSEIGTQRKRGQFLKFIIGPGQAATDFVHEHGRKITEIMTKEPLTISEDTTLEEIVELMEKKPRQAPAGDARGPGRWHRVASQLVAGGSEPRAPDPGSDRRR
jgi:CBS domain-containing protein